MRRLKGSVVALESMLDPRLDDLMAAAMEEHRQETEGPVPPDSIR